MTRPTWKPNAAADAARGAGAGGLLSASDHDHDPSTAAHLEPQEPPSLLLSGWVWLTGSKKWTAFINTLGMDLLLMENYSQNVL